METRKRLYHWHSNRQLELLSNPWSGMGSLFNLPGVYYSTNSRMLESYSCITRLTDIGLIWQSVGNDIFNSCKKFEADNNLFTE